MALATITHACDTIEAGDYLEPFVLPEVPRLLQPNGRSQQRDNYGHILLGTDRRTSFGLGDFFIVDRGSNHGVAPGTHSWSTATSGSRRTSCSSWVRRSPST